MPDSAGSVYVNVLPNLEGLKQATEADVRKVLNAHIYGPSGVWASTAEETRMPGVQSDLTLCARMAEDLVSRFVMLPKTTPSA